MFIAGIILLALGVVCNVIASVVAGSANSLGDLGGGAILMVIGIILDCVGTPLFIVGLVKKIKRNNAAKAAANAYAAQPQFQAQQPQYQQPQQAKTCPACGAVIPAGNAFCPNCGAPVQQ